MTTTSGPLFWLTSIFPKVGADALPGNPKLLFVQFGVPARFTGIKAAMVPVTEEEKERADREKAEEEQPTAKEVQGLIFQSREQHVEDAQD
jgi:hypothetical protein